MLFLSLFRCAAGATSQDSGADRTGATVCIRKEASARVGWEQVGAAAGRASTPAGCRTLHRQRGLIDLRMSIELTHQPEYERPSSKRIETARIFDLQHICLYVAGGAGDLFSPLANRQQPDPPLGSGYQYPD